MYTWFQPRRWSQPKTPCVETAHGDGLRPRFVRGYGLGEGVLGHERLTPKKQEKVEQLLLYDEVKDKYGGAMGDLRVCDLTYV